MTEKQAKTSDRAPSRPAPLVKVCGLTRPSDVDICIAQGVAFVGFNFIGRSKRCVTLPEARTIWLESFKKHDDPKTSPIAVVDGAEQSTIDRLLEEFPELHAIQWHGDESPPVIDRARKEWENRGLTVRHWKALGVGRPEDLDNASRYTDIDLVLFDQRSVGRREFGGSGRRFSWRWLADHRLSQPWGVAGGITPENVTELFRYHPSLIDVSSGVEKSVGIKDAEKIKALLQKVRSDSQ